MSSCLFCDFTSGEKAPARLVHSDEHLIVFWDHKPKAEVHLLVVPRKHLPSLAEVDESDKPLLGEMQWRLSRLMREFHIEDASTSRTNCGERGGQTMFHLHYHLIGGEGIEKQVKAMMHGCACAS